MGTLADGPEGMKIDGVVISCYVLDVYLTRVCVASIRFWYPDLPIWLLKDLNSEGQNRQLIHWAGLRWGKTLEEMPRSEILLHFEEIYYKRVPFGRLLRKWRLAQFRVDRTFITPFKILVKKILARLKGSKAHPAV